MDLDKENDRGTSNKKVERRVNVSLATKTNVIQRLKSGENVNDLCRDCGVHPSTARKWIKKEKIIQDFCDGNSQLNRKRLRDPHNPQLNEALKIWFDHCREQGIPISGRFVQGKAKALNIKMGGNEKFSASDGWLTRWKNRYKITSFTISGEKLSADAPAAERFKGIFEKFITEEKLAPCQIFNADETGLNFKMLPKKTLGARQDHGASGHKMNKDRLTIMPCTNYDGSLKLPLLVIGKSAKPRALKNVSYDTLDVTYRHEAKAWMNCSIFEDWFKTIFAPRVKEFLLKRGLLPKAVLLLDNAGSHPKDLNEDGIRVIFLPPNVTSFIQPLDQGIIENLKKNYRFHFLLSLITEQEKGKSLVEILKEITIKNVIDWIAKSWDEISSSTIHKCWKPLIAETFGNHLQVHVEEQQIQMCEFLSMFIRLQNTGTINEDEVRDWMETADKGDESHELPDDEIISRVQPAIDDVMNVEKDGDDSKICEDGQPGEENALEPDNCDQPTNNEKLSGLIVGPDAAIEAVDSLLDFFESHGSLTPEEMTVLWNMRYTAAVIKYNS
ncbi:jerky protein homolog-like [Diachasma alloeum]|uniref:jerky protein homolog-like n=1 Tax=Diachasma alloeum TaxID=454923 RepID=UPI0007383E9F|nr:jerky protein homolog-like [Diachasma alloeum]